MRELIEELLDVCGGPLEPAELEIELRTWRQIAVGQLHVAHEEIVDTGADAGTDWSRQPQRPSLAGTQ